MAAVPVVFFIKSASGCSPAMVVLLEGGLAGESAVMWGSNVCVSCVYLISGTYEAVFGCSILEGALVGQRVGTVICIIYLGNPRSIV